MGVGEEAEEEVTGPLRGSGKSGRKKVAKVARVTGLLRRSGGSMPRSGSERRDKEALSADIINFLYFQLNIII